MSEVGLYQGLGWKEPIMMYRFRCQKHGWVVDYPHGFKQILECPVCASDDISDIKVRHITREQLAIEHPEIRHISFSRVEEAAKQ